jgi:hypothetical protein
MRFLCVLAIVLMVSCDQLVPIYKNGYGFSLGDTQPKLQIEFFLDFQCGFPSMQVPTPRTPTTSGRV